MLELKEAGGDINTQDAHGVTALMWAIERANYDMVEALVNMSECNLNIQDHEGYTAPMRAFRGLSFSTRGGSRMAIAELLIAQPQLNIKILQDKNDPSSNALTMLVTPVFPFNCSEIEIDMRERMLRQLLCFRKDLDTSNIWYMSDRARKFWESIFEESAMQYKE